MSDASANDEGRSGDASRRTRLASERTLLAWWRTGLTALAVGVGVGRVVPELGDKAVQWPYTVVGTGFAVYGVALIVFGTQRARAIDAAIEAGRFASTPERALTLLALGSIVLALATIALIILA